MGRRRRSSTAALAIKSWELSLAAPQVVAHRLSRMAAAGRAPSASDRKEFVQMGAEKLLAFQQSWAAMWGQLAVAQLEAWRSLYAWPPRSGRASARRAANRHARTVSRVLAAGIAPVHATATANAKRLARKQR